VLVGGIGRPAAAVVGALIIGLASQCAVYVMGAGLAPVGAFVALVVILLARPQGIFGGGRTTLHNA
jgi:branched-subunit amino acid ABC-type transport system permease component